MPTTGAFSPTASSGQPAGKYRPVAEPRAFHFADGLLRGAAAFGGIIPLEIYSNSEPKLDRRWGFGFSNRQTKARRI